MRWLALLALFIASPAWAGMQGMGPVTSSAGASSIAVTAPTVQSGANCDLLAAITNATGQTAALSGWVAQQTCTAGLKQTTFLTKAASGTEGGSYTFTFGGSVAITDARIYAFCGVNTSNPIDQKGCNNSGLASPSLTATVKNEDMLIAWHPGNGNAPTAWPAGIPQSGIDPTNGGEANFSALITNASAQTYTLTASTSSPYSGAVIFNMVANNRAWGVKSFRAVARQASGTSYAMTAPPNITGSEDRIDLLLILENSATPSVSGGSSSWSCSNLASPSGEKIWDCVGTGLQSTDTTYTATWTGSAGVTGFLIDTIWATGTDVTSGQANASASSCVTSTLTTAHANEPVLSGCFVELGSVMGTFPSGVSPLYPPGTSIGGGTAWQNGISHGFEMKATAGVTSARTWSCSGNCGSAISGGIQIAHVLATPVPASTGARPFFMSPF